MHGLSLTQSGVLLDMAFDHFTAICNPLGCASILTNTKIIKIRLEILIKSFMLIIRSFIFIVPIIHLKCFCSCHSYILFHSFCLHQDLLRLSCSDIQQFLCLGSGDLYSFVWSHINSWVLHSDPALSWLFHPWRSGSSPCRPVSLTSVLFCFSIFQSSVWLWCTALGSTSLLWSMSSWATSASSSQLWWTASSTVKTQQICTRIQKWFSMKMEWNILDQKLVSFRKLLAKKESILNIKTLYDMPLSCEKFKDL